MVRKYFPPSQYTPNLYTKGNEFVIKKTNENYVGYYFKTISGLYFTGRNPNHTPSLPLVILSTPPTEEPIDFNVQFVSNWDSIRKPFMVQDDEEFIGNNIDYLFLTSGGRTPLSEGYYVYPPIYSITTPTKEDYDRGFFNRYFLKKNTEVLYGEIEKKEYLKFANSDKSIQSELYTPVSIIWVLKGNREKVYETNKNRVNLIETRGTTPDLNLDPWYGFVNYFNGDFSKYYK